MLLFLFLVLFVLISTHSVETAVIGCHKDRNKDHLLRVSCVSQGLAAVPDGIDPGTQALVLSRNVFVSLTWTSYTTFTHLYELDLTQNLISTINPAGPVLEYLTVLRLSDNKLTSLRRATFNSTPSLMEVYLEGNSISSIDDATFSNLPRLELINLSRNKLHILPTHLLEHISSSNLKTLDLEDNRIQHLPDKFFVSKMEIPYVFLSKNLWVCTCQVSYLQKYLEDQGHNIYTHRENSTTENDPEGVVCSAPLALQGQAVVDLNEEEYCSSDTEPPTSSTHIVQLTRAPTTAFSTTTATQPNITKTQTIIPTTTDTPTIIPKTTDTPTIIPTTPDTPTIIPTTTDTPTIIPTTTDTPTIIPTTTDTPTIITKTTNTPTIIPTTTNTPTIIPTKPNTPTIIPTTSDTQTIIPTTTNTPTIIQTTDTPTITKTTIDTPTITPATDTPTIIPTTTNTATIIPTTTNTATIIPTTTNTATIIPTTTDTPAIIPTTPDTPTIITTSDTQTIIQTTTDTPTIIQTTDTPTITKTTTDTPTITPATDTPTIIPTTTDTATIIPTTSDAPTMIPTTTGTPIIITKSAKSGNASIPNTLSTNNPIMFKPVVTVTRRAGAAVVARGGGQRSVIWCWWLFSTVFLLCIVSAIFTCVLFLWLVIIYIRLYQPIKRRVHGGQGVILRAYATADESHAADTSVEERVPFLQPDMIRETQPVFRSVLFVCKGAEDGEADERKERVRKEDKEKKTGSDAVTKIDLLPAVTLHRAQEMDREEVFRKTFYRLIRREEEIEGWKDVEENCWGMTERAREKRDGEMDRQKARYSLILREERGSVMEGRKGESEWLVDEWEMRGPRGSWRSLIRIKEGRGLSDSTHMDTPEPKTPV